MYFPESLYLLSERDQQGTFLDPFIFTASSTSAAGSVSAQTSSSPPLERCLILQSISARASPGAAQSITFMQLRLLLVAGQFHNISSNYTATAANVAASLNWTGSLLLPARAVLDFNAQFNAGAAANTVECTWMGMYVPIGNIQRTA